MIFYTHSKILFYNTSLLYTFIFYTYISFTLCLSGRMSKIALEIKRTTDEAFLPLWYHLDPVSAY